MMDITRRGFCGSAFALAAMGAVPSVAKAEAGNLIQGYGSTISEVIGKSFGEVKALAAELGNPAHLFFVNHPQWRFWDVLTQDVLDHPEVRFFEICNCGSDIPLSPHMSEKDFSCDRFWDIVLANRCRVNGNLLYGIGTDDAHWYPNSGTPQNPFPFADAYIQVRADALTPEALVAAMDSGDFYAGVRGTVHFAGDAAQSIGARDYPLYSDSIGITLKSVSGKPGERVEASYALQDDDLYVRAIVESSEPVTGYAKTSHQHPQRKLAWTQPIRRP